MMDLEADEATYDLQTVTRLQQLKTGALIGFCLEAGAIMGRLPPEGRAPLRGYARDVGLAFQIADDILDVEGDEAVAGKALGKDQAAGKATFLSLLGLERAKMQAQALIDQAIAHLGQYGTEADLLRDVARFTIERDR
jgi:farnesyl diphosphate synthase